MFLTAQVAGIAFPQSQLCMKALAFARETYMDPMIFNHHPRVYLWGAMVATAKNIAFDAEQFFLAAMLHNLGFSKHFQGPDRFEVNSANAATTFLRRENASQDTIDTVWQAIAFHTSNGIALHLRPEIALTHIGAGIDTLGINADQLPEHARDAVLNEFPRLGFKQGFYEAIERVVRKNPAVTPFTWMADIAKEAMPGFTVPTFKQVMQSSVLQG
jgi:hypothetical protein